MKINRLNKFLSTLVAAVAAFVIGLLGVNTGNAANFQFGYTIGGGALGPTFFDTAVGGGGDSGTAADLGFMVQMTNLWQVGETIKITGVALPIRTATTSAGTWTFEFYELDQGTNANSYEGNATETVVGSATVEMLTDVTSIGAYYATFDTPIIFTAQSKGIAVRFTTTTLMRLKINTGGAQRLATATGIPSGGTYPGLRFTLAGSVVLPPPAGSLVWKGNVNGDWDGATANWNYSLGNYAGFTTNYYDNGTFGPPAIFDDTLNVSFLRTNINLTTGTPLRPSSLTFANDIYDYTLGGPGKITGGTVLTNSGARTVTLNTANNFTGGSVLKNGRIRLGNVAGLGTGPITFGGGGVSSVGATPLTITNPVFLSGGAILGNATDNGAITFPGTLNFNGGAYPLTVESAALLSGVLTNGGISAKTGPGTLTITGQVATTNGNWNVRDGVLIASGVAVQANIQTFNVAASANNGVATLVITNGANVRMSQTFPVNEPFGPRVGAQGQSSLSSSNYLILAGSFGYATNASGPIGFGNYCAYAGLEMYPGSLLRVSGLPYQGASVIPPSTTVFNINGGTIEATRSNTNFMSGHTAVNILAGGVTFDTETNSITIAQPLLDGGGSGGLTKVGSGTLWLSGANTYAGPTLAQVGTLGLYPGNVLAAASSLTVSSGASVAVDFVPIGAFPSEVSSLSLNGSGVAVNCGDLSGAPSASVALSYSPGGGLALNANGVNTINITGQNLGIGQYPIIQFASRTGTGTFVPNTTPNIVGTIVTNGNTIAFDLQEVLLTITTQPQSQRVLTNTPATFFVVIDGNPAPSYYQWYQVANGITNAISGANSDTYITPPVQDSDTGKEFFVVCSNVNNSVVTSATAVLTAGHQLIASGYLRREIYTNLTSAVDTLTARLYPNSAWLGANPPFSSGYLTSFNAPANLPNNAGQRIYGWFTPPVSGDYVFFETSDDAATVWLSPDSTSTVVYQIAQNQLWMQWRDWTLTNTASGEYPLLSSGEWRSDQFTINGGVNAFAAFISGWSPWPTFNYGNGGIPLVAGTRYYIEMDAHQAAGGQNATVTYKLAGSADPVSGTATLLTGADISGQFLDTELPIAAPVITDVSLSGGNVNLTGTYGLANAAYNVLTTPDVTLPISSWTVLGSAYSSSSGGIAYSTSYNPAAGQHFYRIQIP
jgi:autotransporter-associated beta strand protein